MLKKYPEVAVSLKDFTCFDRMTSPLPRTMYAVPAMLTGCNYSDREFAEYEHDGYLKLACRKDSSLFRLCGEAGWRREGYPFILQTISYAPDVIDNSRDVDYHTRGQSILKIAWTVMPRLVPEFILALFPAQAPPGTPFVIPTDGSSSRKDENFDQVFFRRLTEEFRLGEFPRGLKYLHLQGAHDPVRTDEHLARSPGTNSVRQLRGSMRNVELLLEKMKQSGIYDRALIVIIGDHTELYTPEVIAFVKRPGEYHDAVVVNSISCQVADVAGTAAKETGLNAGAKSLFDSAPAAGSLQTVHSEATAGLDLPAWRVMETPFEYDSGGQILSNCFVDERRLVVEYRNIPPGLRELSLIVERLDGHGRWIASAPATGSSCALRSCELTMPDGVYRVITRETYAAGEGTFNSFALCDKYLILSGGRARSVEEAPKIPEVPLQIGETIRFGMMQLYPQLRMPDGADINLGGLYFGQDKTLGSLLPPDRPRAKLKINMPTSAAFHTEITVSCGAVGKVNTSAHGSADAIVEIKLPAARDAEMLELRFFISCRTSLPKRPIYHPSVRIGGISLEPIPEP